MRIKQIVYASIGFLTLLLGAIGVLLPILPTTPFLLVSAFCFAKSSQRLDDWFKGTKLYKNNLESYVRDKTMSRRVKVKIMLMVTAIMLIAFIAMDEVVIGRIAISIVWIFHVIYFTFFIKTSEKA